MGDVNINKTSFLSYVMNHQDTSDTVFPYSASFVTLQYENYESQAGTTPKVTTSYVGNLIHGLLVIIQQLSMGAANNTFKAYTTPTAYKIYQVNDAYNVNIEYNTSTQMFSIPAAAPPVTHNLYNI